MRDHHLLLLNVCTFVCMCVFSLLATMNEVSCYHPGICSFLSNHSFCSSLHRPGIDLREEGSRYTWGQGHLIATWEKNDVGPGREISNRAIRRTKGIETKTEGILHSLISLITFFILRSGCFRLIFWGLAFVLDANGLREREGNHCQKTDCTVILNQMVSYVLLILIV